MPDADARRDTLERRLAEARAVLVFERLWPAAVAAACLIGIFLASAWSGLWVALPSWLRPPGLLLFALGFAALGVSALRRRLPGRREALARLDRDSGDPHRPISARDDALADPDADAGTRALWAIHRRRLDGALARVRVRPPSPRTVERDPFALRAAVLLLAVAAAFAAGPDRDGRLAAAFDWRDARAAGARFRLDAWIDPPPYTGRPPLVLTGGAPAASADGAPGDGEPRAVSAPVGSAIVIRASGDGTVEVATDGAVEPAPARDAASADAANRAGSGTPATSSLPRSPPLRPAAPVASSGSAVAPAADGSQAERRFVLAGDGRLTVRRDGTAVARYAIRAIPDLPPTIALDGRPIRNGRGSLTLRYTIGDDYGAAGAEALLSDPVVGGAPVTGRTLVPPPKLALALPGGPRGLGKGETTADLTDSPWAGATATMVLTARDEGGNTGRSAPSSVVLPARAFAQPLARALVEQRRDLVLDPDHRGTIDTALDALTLAPDVFGMPPAVYLGLRTAKGRLDGARGDADLLAVSDLLWAMALQIEDGDLSQTERDLKAMQQELRDALARNAPPEEVRKLTQALREQLDKFLSEMARRSDPSDEAERRPDARAQTVTPKQLQSMLDRMEQAAREGDTAEAQRLLDELRGVLDNLKTAKRRSGSQRQAQRQMNESMGALDKLTRDQQALRDNTFRQGRGRDGGQDGDPDDPQGGDPQPGAERPRGGGQPGEAQSGDGKGDDGKGDDGGLQGRQGALRRKLGELQKQMRDMGLEGEKGFDAAGRAMKEAEDALGAGPGGEDRAVEAQGRALRGLQQGAQGLAKQMAQGRGEGEGQGEGEDAAADGEEQEDGTGGPDGQKLDPLGRPRASRGLGTGRNDGLARGPDEGLAARARQVLEELRRRLGDPSRPQAEQDYLERLLKRY